MPRGYVAPRYAQRQQAHPAIVAQRDGELAAQKAEQVEAQVATVNSSIATLDGRITDLEQSSV